MDKYEFDEELKAVVGYMSEEEIGKAIDAIDKCKRAIFKEHSRMMSEISELLQNAEQNEAMLTYSTRWSKTGKLKVLGASMLSTCDFNRYYHKIPAIGSEWWLNDKIVVVKSDIDWRYNKSVAYVRPILIVSDPRSSGLYPGNVFYINEEKFKLLSNSIAIKTRCLGDVCSFTEDYENSLIKFCVDGWYARLVRVNKLRESEAADKAATEN